MTEEPTEVIAPREDLPRGTIDYLEEMLDGVYSHGAVLEYHGFQLESHHHEDGARVWSVYNADGEFIEAVNLEAFRTLTELEAFLEELVAYDPANRTEWVSR